MKKLNIVFVTFVIFSPFQVKAEENCNTSLTRIGHKAINKAIAEHQSDACSGLRTSIFGVNVGLDVTKQLTMQDYKLCESGPIVKAVLTIHVQCSTSDEATVPVSISDDLTASAVFDLDKCELANINIHASKKMVQAGLDVVHIKDKLRNAANSKLKEFCN